ncbi:MULTISPECIES: ATP-dependent Clp protease ATP-binding subunit [unclassified Variovorax]|uniref:ATP-dependent Clp protease ATP-binding subunit n=1 Tax=unclassified Variovorax TaxID=663243 RepID=UPI0025757B12|nr:MULTISPECIES: ATP-dependent Clp protease ATP-binding subunit [unclassified Variovorax]MDM0090109.1 ATP-dependent Clp protease ATP-binding subunit [Variovorax sp. J22G40]MDM0148225.1 ATP-dependent Clp protease ATP-binding subunit [Variovorax sp. J2P1-31]
MAKCDVCGRPASTQLTLREGGQTRQVALCDEHYAETMARTFKRSPLESLFGGGLFDEFQSFFGDRGSLFGRSTGTGSAGSDKARPQAGAPRRQRSRDAVDLRSFLNEAAMDRLQGAAEKALEYGKDEVDTEHLLLALLDNEIVQEILRDYKLSEADLRSNIEENAPRGERKVEKDDTPQISVSPRAKSALEHAMIASRELGHSYLGPEHILVGLVQEEDGFAGELLRKLGLSSQSLRQKVVKVVGQGAEEGKLKQRSGTPTLDKYSRDLSDLARQGKLDPVIGRAQEIETTIEVLARRKKNNPVLIGEPGVGKTAIVEGLAQRIVQDQVPDVLRGKRVMELNINSMVAGAKYRGEFEERVKQVLDEIIDRQDELIIFIDELHTIVGAGAGGGEGGLDIANVFKPALARGELHLIGATTLNEYQKYIEKDAALERRFQPVTVPEPGIEDTIEILRGLRDRLEAHHKVKISEGAIEAAAKLSARYIAARFLPDKAIDLIDQAAARVRIHASSRPQDLQHIEANVRKLRQEQDAAGAAKQYDKAKALGDRIKGDEKKLEDVTAAWKKRRGTSSSEVSVEDVAQIVSALTGVPVSELTSEDREKLLRLEDRLRDRVVGQEEAVHAVSEAVRLARAGLGEAGRPTATFLFLGPTGVGKTELAKALAATVFGSEESLVRIDMSEYAERHTVARLVGAPPGYVGYEEGGQLTERVRRRPYSVVLLDEIEKAHSEVHNILLQLFDEGRLTDGKGRVIDFTNTIIIATSNLGSEVIQRNLKAEDREVLAYPALRDRLMELLRHHFRPEFLNRVDEVVVFHALGKREIHAIVGLQLQRVSRTAAAQKVQLTFDDSLVDHLAEIGYDPEFGARMLKRKLRSEVESRLATALLKGEVSAGQSVKLGYDPIQKALRIDKVSDATAGPKRRADAGGTKAQVEGEVQAEAEVGEARI